MRLWAASVCGPWRQPVCLLFAAMIPQYLYLKPPCAGDGIGRKGSILSAALKLRMNEARSVNAKLRWGNWNRSRALKGSRNILIRKTSGIGTEQYRSVQNSMGAVTVINGAKQYEQCAEERRRIAR
jgi:hypothetical protein